MAKMKPDPKKKKKEFDPSKLSDKQLESGFGGKDAQGIAQLAAAIKEQNKEQQSKKTDTERNDLLSQLVADTDRKDKLGKTNALSIQKSFAETSERLKTAIASGDQKQIDLETKNQESVLTSAEQERKRREAQKANKKQNKLLEGIKGSIGNLASKFKDNAGFLAGLAGVALAIFNPVKLQEYIDRTVAVIIDAFDIVSKLFEGDFKGALELFKENWKDISLALGLVVALNFGKIVKVIGIVKNGMMGIQAAMAAAGIGLGPAILIGAAIALTIAALVKTFQKVKSVFDETGSAFEAFKAGLVEFPAQIFGIPFNLLKKAMTFMADLFGLETKYDPDFDFVAMFRNLFTSIQDGIIGFVNGAIKIFSDFSFTDLFSTIQDKMNQVFDDLVERFSQLKLIIKAFGAGAFAAIKAAAPGGESPSEAYTRVYAEVMSTGSATDKVDKLEVSADDRGDELDMSSMNNKMEGQFFNQAAAPVTITNVDNSSRSNSNTSVVSGRSGRKRGFGTSTELAYG